MSRVGYRSFKVGTVTCALSLISTRAMAGGPAPAVPEPGSAALLIAGIAGLLIAGRFWRGK